MFTLFLSGNQSNIVFIQLRRKSRLFARSQWRLVELHDMEKGGGRKFSKTFFSSKDSGKAPLHFQGKGIRGEEKQRWENKDRWRCEKVNDFFCFCLLIWKPWKKDARVFAFVPSILFLPRLWGLTPSEAMRCEWAMPCGNGQTLSKRKHGVCLPRFSFFSSLLVALCCLEVWGSAAQADGGKSCSPCPVNCSCPLGPQQSCVVNCSSIGLERAPAAEEIPLATNVL